MLAWLTRSWLAWRSLARALSPPASIARPTDTMKFSPVVLDFIDTGGLVSSESRSDKNVSELQISPQVSPSRDFSPPGGVGSLLITEPCGMLVGKAVRGK